jgi:hypothetical protein
MDIKLYVPVDFGTSKPMYVKSTRRLRHIFAAFQKSMNLIKIGSNFLVLHLTKFGKNLWDY